MDLKQRSRTGLRLSATGIGTLIWRHDIGDPEALDMLRRFVGAGSNLVECSASHGDGMAVDILSEAISTVGRHRVIVAWRGGVRRASEGAWVSAAGRGGLLRSLDNAPTRLDVDYVGVWMVEPRPEAPLEETLEAATAAHRSGRTRYVGLSWATRWQLAEAVTHGVLGMNAPISVVKFPFSLTDTSRAARVAELSKHGVGVIIASALADGALAGKYRHSTPADPRAASPHFYHLAGGHLTGLARGVIEAATHTGAELERSTDDVAFAWVRDYPGIANTLVGSRTLRQPETLLDYTESLPAPIRQILSEVAQQ